jgi:signal transduction histidine kinase/CheY-like chemotaxis protein
MIASAAQESPEEELLRLRRENRELGLAVKKQTRAISLMESQIERTRISTEARESVSRLVAVKRSELDRYMSLLLANCPDIILLFDKQSRIVYCTDSFLAICGIPVVGVIYGKTYGELMSPYATQKFMDRLDGIFRAIQHNKRPISFDDSLDFGRDGNFRSYSIHAAPMLEETGEMVGAMLTFVDTTEIREARHAAERASAAKSDFLATVSHEIRTPMNAIIGVSNMMKDTRLDKTQQRYMSNIMDSSEVLLQLINDILDFSRIEAGKLELIEGYFDFISMLKHLESMLALMFRQKGLRFLCRFDDDLPRVVYGDDKRIRQILTNVLNNAMKYTREGSVRFHVYRDNNGWIRFSITDTGIGIHEDALPRLFNEFEQLDMVKNKGITGTGLGLAITKKLCMMMGGKITAESKYGKGSRFVVYLKLQEGDASNLDQLGETETLQFTAEGAKVLLVDDIEVNLEIASYMLNAYGIQADRVMSGREAIEQAAAKDYHLILMDHMMPEMDGVAATGLIRKSETDSKHVPIVALTANAISGAMEMFLENGFDGFLSKPIDSAALTRCLLKWLPKDLITITGDGKSEQ